MKLIYGFLLTLLIISCSTDDDNNNSEPSVIKPIRITVSEVGDSPYTMEIEYNQNLITKVEFSFGRTITVEYNSNNTIASYKIQEGTSSITYPANYENGLLKSLGDYNFYYNGNEQVNKTVESDNGFIIETFFEYDTIGNVNISFDDYSTFRFTYDNKNNAFKNVFPQIDPEVTWAWFGNLINNQIVVEEKLSTETEFSTQYTYEYDFNSNDYPTERRQKEINGNISEIVTYEYQ